MGRFVNKRVSSKDRKHDTENKKNKYCSDIVECVDKYLSIFIKVLPFLGLFAILPLNYYADEESIDIFNHYSSWVSVLPVIAVAGTGIAVLMTLYCLSIVFIIDSLSPRYKGNKLCNKGQANQCFLLVIFQYFFLVLFPVLTFYSVGLEDFRKLPFILILLYVLYFSVFNVLFVNSIFLNKEKITEQFWVNYSVSGVGVDHLFAKAFNKVFFNSLLLAACVPFISIALSEFFIGGIYSSRSVDGWGGSVGIGILT